MTNLLRLPSVRVMFGILFAATLLGALLLLALAQKRAGEPAQQVRPRRVAENTSTANSSATTGSIIKVAPGGDLQRALNDAHCGATIILEAGATYRNAETYTLPNKGRCSGTDADFITIETSNLAGIAAPGERLDPAVHAAAMPKLVGTSSHAIISAATGAHHYKLIGIEITTNGKAYTPDLINMGAYFPRQDRLDTSHFVFDRVFLHPAEISSNNLLPSTVERTSGRGIGFAVSDVWVINSYIAGFCGRYPRGMGSDGQNIDSYGVYSDAGPGPIHIINNYIESQFNNVFIGGAGMSTTNTATVTNATAASATLSNVNNLAVGDLVAFSYARCTAAVGPNGYAKPWETGRITGISGNRVTFTPVKAQNSCEPGPPDNGGTARWKGDLIENVEIRRNTLNKPDVWNAFSNPKAWIEIKVAKGLIIDGNDMYSGVGTNIAFTVRNQDGSSPWSTIEDVTFTNNRMRGYKWGFGLLLTDNEQPSAMAGNILIKNNLFTQPRPYPDSAANFLQLVGGHHLTVEHNTIVQPGSPVVADQATSNFVFRDNIVANYQYGMQCTMPPNTLMTCWPAMIMKGNILIDNRSDRSDGSLSSRYPVGNFVVNSARDVGFVDLANENYQLAATSKVRGRASDGTDPGCDMKALKAAIEGR